MEYLTVIATSSVVAAIVSAISSRYSQNNNYKLEYYKQLISKRLKAYEAVEEVITFLSGHAVAEGEKSVPRAFWNRENYIDIFRKIIFAMTQSMWLSNDVRIILQNINTELTQATFKFKLDKPDVKDEVFRQAGLDRDERLSELKDDLFEQVTADFKIIHDIESFNKV